MTAEAHGSTESGITVRVESRPEPARTNDGNDWSDGRCWLWCGQKWTRVIWLGPVRTTGGISAPFTACGGCVQILHDAIWEYVTATARGVRAAGVPAFGTDTPQGHPDDAAGRR
nr:hypothetical protein OH820_20450 [Streptomyces sp. NBC_00857]